MIMDRTKKDKVDNKPPKNAKEDEGIWDRIFKPPCENNYNRFKIARSSDPYKLRPPKSEFERFMDGDNGDCDNGKGKII